MKKFFIVLCLIFVIGCIDLDETESYEQSNDCTRYTDLCGDGGYDSYYICCSPYTYDCWWEVNGVDYYNVDHMWRAECE